MLGERGQYRVSDLLRALAHRLAYAIVMGTDRNIRRSPHIWPDGGMKFPGGDDFLETVVRGARSQPRQVLIEVEFKWRTSRPNHRFTASVSGTRFGGSGSVQLGNTDRIDQLGTQPFEILEGAVKQAHNLRIRRLGIEHGSKHADACAAQSARQEKTHISTGR